MSLPGLDVAAAQIRGEEPPIPVQPETPPAAPPEGAPPIEPNEQAKQGTEIAELKGQIAAMTETIRGLAARQPTVVTAAPPAQPTTPPNFEEMSTADLVKYIVEQQSAGMAALRGEVSGAIEQMALGMQIERAA